MIDHTLDLNFNTHFPLRGSKTMESCGFISSSHLPGLSGTPLHDSYFKIKAERSNRNSIIAILKLAYATQQRTPFQDICEVHIQISSFARLTLTAPHE